MSDDLEILTQAWDAVVLVLGRHTDPGIRRPLARASANIEIASRAIRSAPGSRGAAPLPPKESSATMSASTDNLPDGTVFLPDGTRVRDERGRLGTVVSRNWATAETHERVLFDHSRIILRFRRDSLAIATPRDTGYTGPNTEGGGTDLGALLFLAIFLASLIGTIILVASRPAPAPCAIVYHGVNYGSEQEVDEWNWFVESVARVNYEPTGDGYGIWTYNEAPDSGPTFLGASEQEDSDIWNSPACLPAKGLVGS